MARKALWAKSFLKKPNTAQETTQDALYVEDQEVT